MPFPSFKRGRLATDQFGLIELNGVSKTVALSGVHVPLCDGDDVAASGTYRYEPRGGLLIVSGRTNVAKVFDGYLSRLGVLIWSFYPQWCGFPQVPINNPG